MKLNLVKRLLQTIAIFDFVSYKPKLLYKGKNNFQSSIGGFISILTIGFLFSFGIYFFVQLFQRNNMNITSNDMVLEWPVYNMSNMPFIFKLVDGNAHDIANDSSVYNLQGLFSSAPPFTFYYKLEPCNISNVKHFGEYRKYFKKIENISNFTCIDDLNKYNFSLFGTYQNNELPRSFINIILNVCQNTTSNTSNKDKPCKAKSLIDNTLASVYLNLVYLEYKIDHNNFNDPGLITVSTEILSFSSSIYKRYNFFYFLIDYQTDEGFLFPLISKKLYFQRHDIDVSVDLRVQNAGNTKFGQICFYLSKDQKSYFRKYIKVQEVIASIGGVLSSVLFLANLVLYHVSRRLFLIRLANDSYVSKEKDNKRRISRFILDKDFNEEKSRDSSRKDDICLRDSYDSNIEKEKSNYFKKREKSKENINNLEESYSIPDENKSEFNFNGDKSVRKFVSSPTEIPKNLNILPEKSMKLFLAEEEGNQTSKDPLKRIEKTPIGEIKIKELVQTKKPKEKIFKSSEINDKIKDLSVDNSLFFEIEPKEKTKTKNIFFYSDFNHSVDENGKLKEDFKNIFWPNKRVKKLYDFIEKRSGLDSTLHYCSQIEKIKKFLFQTKEEISLFNNLPDLDVDEIMDGNERSEENLKNSIMKIKEKNPDTKLIKMIKNL